MKIIGAVALLLASAGAFVPLSDNNMAMRSSSSALNAASVDESTSSRSPNPAIKVMAQGMGLLKPIFSAEAQLQAAILGNGVDSDQVQAEIKAETANDKVLIYTYGLSPFSSEAVAMLDASGYPYTKVELGPEWFLLGGQESVKRMELSKQVENGATSLPKIFIGGKCIGGCSELASLVESGELDTLMKKANVGKQGAATKKKVFGLF